MSHPSLLLLIPSIFRESCFTTGNCAVWSLSFLSVLAHHTHAEISLLWDSLKNRSSRMIILRQKGRLWSFRTQKSGLRSCSNLELKLLYHVSQVKMRCPSYCFIGYCSIEGSSSPQKSSSGVLLGVAGSDRRTKLLLYVKCTFPSYVVWAKLEATQIACNKLLDELIGGQCMHEWAAWKPILVATCELTK
jgi:hypothetical protein